MERGREEILDWETRTWYGLPVRVLVSSSNLHRVWANGVVLPHFGLVNLFARQGLPTRVRLELTARHELGHLQTLPVPLLHLLALFLARPTKKGSPWARWLLIGIAHQAVWEIAAESYVLATDSRARAYPRPSWARWVYRLFWALMALLAVLPTYWLVRHRPTD